MGDIWQPEQRFTVSTLPKIFTEKKYLTFTVNQTMFQASDITHEGSLHGLAEEEREGFLVSGCISGWVWVLCRDASSQGKKGLTR